VIWSDIKGSDFGRSRADGFRQLGLKINDQIPKSLTMKIINKFLILIAALPLSVKAVCQDGKTYPVHFTFDDGPHPALTPRVLNILKEEKVPSTFFVLGNRFAGGKSNPETKTAYALLDRMKREGHRIGSHTYEHLNHPQYSAAEIKENIMKPNLLLKDYLSPVLRLPYGGGSFRSSNPQVQAKNDLVMNTVKKAGFKHVGWHVDTNDWDEKRRPQLLSKMLKDICFNKGGIVLFHDIQKFTVDNLHDWIKAIKREGHTFAPLEHFVPEAAKPLPPEACDTIAPAKDIEAFDRQINKIIQELGK
jgi:peptidoglycan-N-acetylglucosamine deacetylase